MALARDSDVLVVVGEVKQDKHRPVPQSLRLQLRSVRRVEASGLVGSQVVVVEGTQRL